MKSGHNLMEKIEMSAFGTRPRGRDDIQVASVITVHLWISELVTDLVLSLTSLVALMMKLSESSEPNILHTVNLLLFLSFFFLFCFVS